MQSRTLKTLFSHKWRNQYKRTALILITDNHKFWITWQDVFDVVFFSFSFLAEIKVWKEVAVKRVKSSWILGLVETIDSHDVPVVFYVRVAEGDLGVDTRKIKIYLCKKTKRSKNLIINISIFRRGLYSK